MSEPFQHEVNQQLLREARRGLTLVALTLIACGYFMYQRVKSRMDFPEHVINAPVGQEVTSDPFTRSVDMSVEEMRKKKHQERLAKINDRIQLANRSKLAGRSQSPGPIDVSSPTIEGVSKRETVAEKAPAMIADRNSVQSDLPFREVQQAVATGEPGNESHSSFNAPINRAAVGNARRFIGDGNNVIRNENQERPTSAGLPTGERETSQGLRRQELSPSPANSPPALPPVQVEKQLDEERGFAEIRANKDKHAKEDDSKGVQTAELNANPTESVSTGRDRLPISGVAAEVNTSAKSKFHPTSGGESAEPANALRGEAGKRSEDSSANDRGLAPKPQQAVNRLVAEGRDEASLQIFEPITIDCNSLQGDVVDSAELGAEIPSSSRFGATQTKTDSAEMSDSVSRELLSAEFSTNEKTFHPEPVELERPARAVVNDMADSSFRPLSSVRPPVHEFPTVKPRKRQRSEDIGNEKNVSASAVVVNQAMREAVVQVSSETTLWDVCVKQYGDGRFFRALHAANQSQLGDRMDLEASDSLVVPSIEALQKNYHNLLPVDLRDSRLVPRESVTEAGTSDSRVYVTKSGDTLFNLARQRWGQGSRFNEIIEMNQFRLPQGVTGSSPLPAKIKLVLPR